MSMALGIRHRSSHDFPAISALHRAARTMDNSPRATVKANGNYHRFPAATRRRLRMLLNFKSWNGRMGLSSTREWLRCFDVGLYGMRTGRFGDSQNWQQRLYQCERCAAYGFWPIRRGGSADPMASYPIFEQKPVSSRAVRQWALLRCHRNASPWDQLWL